MHTSDWLFQSSSADDAAPPKCPLYRGLIMLIQTSRLAIGRWADILQPVGIPPSWEKFLRFKPEPEHGARTVPVVRQNAPPVSPRAPSIGRCLSTHYICLYGSRAQRHVDPLDPAVTDFAAIRSAHAGAQSQDRPGDQSSPDKKGRWLPRVSGTC